MSKLLARAPAVGMAGFIALLPLVGCGGGGSSIAESTGTLTKAQFLKSANAICAKGSKAMGRLDAAFWKRHGGGGKGSTSEAVLNDLAESFLPVRKKELRLIRALGRPRGSERYVEKMLTVWQEGIENGEEDPSSLRHSGRGFAFYKAFSMGIDYGLTKCWLG